MSYIFSKPPFNAYRVEQGYAPRLQSDRFESANEMMCPTWSGFDGMNRTVCKDSYYTKSPGCNSPLDRVHVENNLRPGYMELIGLDSEGFRDNLYTNTEMYTPIHQNCSNTCCQPSMENMRQIHNLTGTFLQAPIGNPNKCQIFPTFDADFQTAYNQNNRKLQAMQHAVIAQNMRAYAGI